MSEQVNSPSITNIAILANPLAGKGDSHQIVAWLEIELIKKNIEFIVFKNQWPDNFDSFSDIWIMGGDGSINYFINRFQNCKIPITLFKTGTGNDFSWKLYGDASNKQIFETALLSTEIGRAHV